MESIEFIRDFLKDRLNTDPETVVPDAVLAELGVDSLAMLELIFEFEDRYSIDIPDDATPPKTVGDLVTFVDGFIATHKQA